MAKPYQSKLIAHEAEIAALRATRPPTPYTRIAEILREKYALSVHRDTIHSFVRVRSHGRKVFCFARPLEASSRGLNAKVAVDLQPPDLGLPALSAANDGRPKPRFDYTPSDRYNLTRLTPEQAIILEKQSAEGK